MPQPEARKFLFDILQACRLLTEFLSRKSLDDYLREPMLRSAVERQFEIIGEALNQALRVEPGLAMETTDVSRIIAFRNRLAHAYATVSDEVVWGVVEASLPRLSKEVADALGSSEGRA